MCVLCVWFWWLQRENRTRPTVYVLATTCSTAVRSGFGLKFARLSCLTTYQFLAVALFWQLHCFTRTCCGIVNRKWRRCIDLLRSSDYDASVVFAIIRSANWTTASSSTTATTVEIQSSSLHIPEQQQHRQTTIPDLSPFAVLVLGAGSSREIIHLDSDLNVLSRQRLRSALKRYIVVFL